MRLVAFGGCGALSHLSLPSSLSAIEIAAKYACSSFTSLEISDSVTQIGDFSL